MEQRELLLECFESADRELFQFFKQRFIHGLEIEARFALHAGFELWGNASERFGGAIDTHVMKADVGFVDFNPGNRKWALVGWVAAARQAITSGTVFTDR